MDGLGKPEQEEFAANFTDTLAGSATAAGDYAVARQVYETLLARYDREPGAPPEDPRRPGPDRHGRQARARASPPRTSREGPSASTDLRGKYVLIDFWATWCAPCVAELPRLQAAYARYHEAGFEIVGVSLDESKSAVVDFVRSRKIPWRQIHNASAGGRPRRGLRREHDPRHVPDRPPGRHHPPRAARTGPRPGSGQADQGAGRRAPAPPSSPIAASLMSRDG